MRQVHPSVRFARARSNLPGSTHHGRTRAKDDQPGAG